MKKIILSIAFALFGITSSFAAKAYPGPITVIQSDGTELTVYLHGDEHFNWLTTADGVLLKQEASSYFIAKVTNAGELEKTKYLAHNPAHRTIAEQNIAAKQDLELFLQNANKAQAKSMAAKTVGKPSVPYFQHRRVNGKNPKALVLLVEFSDSTFKSGEKAKDVFDYYLSAKGDTPIPEGYEVYNLPQKKPSRFGRYVNHGSVSQYFSDMSNGEFCPEFDVKGPFKLPQKSSYYGEGENDKPQDMMEDACAAAHQAGVDFSQYDIDNDGYVDLVYLIYAGYTASVDGITEHIWPKSGTISPLKYDGKYIGRYGINNELNMTPTASAKQGGYLLNGIGLFCHEFSHCLGLPDLYATKSTGKVDDHCLEEWDLMDGGEYLNEGYCPAPYSPWELDVMDWAKPTVLTDEPQQIHLSSFIDTKQSYKIEGENNEYLLLHNIQNTGWNQYMPSHGMIVYRIDYSKSAVNTSDYPNNQKNPGVTIVPADGKLLSSYSVDNKVITKEEYKESMKTDLYPTVYKKDGKDILVDQILSIKLNKSTLEKPLYNIKEEAGIITFDYLKDFSTGIDSPIINHDDEKDAHIYTLDGRYLGTDAQHLNKGVYIINKKKVVIK